MGKINRFPKMMILHKVVSEKILYPEIKDENFHKSYGYYVATVYAIMKKISTRVKKEFGGRKLSKREKEEYHRNLFEPNYEEIDLWNFVESPNPLHKYMWFRKVKTKGIKTSSYVVYIDGKSVYGNIKYDDQVNKKFENIEEYKKYEKYIEKLIEENEEYQDKKFWLGRKWFNKVWKEIRDLDWDEVYEREMKENEEMKIKEIKIGGLFDINEIQFRNRKLKVS